MKRDYFPSTMMIICLLFLVFILAAFQYKVKLAKEKAQMDPFYFCELVSKEKTRKTQNRLHGKISYTYYETINKWDCDGTFKKQVVWERW